MLMILTMTTRIFHRVYKFIMLLFSLTRPYVDLQVQYLYVLPRSTTYKQCKTIAKQRKWVFRAFRPHAKPGLHAHGVIFPFKIVQSLICSASKFGIVFGTPFFIFFYDFGSILVHILVAFLCNFLFFLYDFPCHRFCRPFITIRHLFLRGQNL